ncbi:MAG: peptide/nickel transport system substrate-binding protein [Acidimicrobiaceae bacterium]
MSHTAPSRATWRRLLIVLSAFTIAVTACGGSSGSSSSSSSGGGGGGSSSDTSKPTVGGKVVYSIEAETTGGFCLAEAQLAAAGIQVARSIFDTLAAPNDAGDYKPYLAKSITPSADYKSWTIGLRDGVKFSDGTALDATVVKNNIDAYRGKYANRHPLLFVFVFSNIADVTVVDPMTVKVDMTLPWIDFPAYLFSSGRLGMMGQAQLDDATGCDKNLVGTGPFMAKGAVTSTTDIDLFKNPSYWQKDADGTQLPYLDELEYRAIPDDTARLNALQSKQIDVMHTDVPQVITQLQPLADSGTIALTTSDKQAETAYAMFNESKPPFDNADARAAVVLAFDNKTYNDTQNAGLLATSNGPFAPGNVGHLDSTGFATFDKAAAQAKVAAYKATTGQDLAFTYSTSNEPITIQGAQLVQQMMKDVGVTVTLANTDQSQLINQAIAGDFQMVGWRNHPGGDPDTQYVWWHSGSPVNFGRINDPKVDSLLDDGRSNPDAAARKKDYEDLNKQFATANHNLWEYWVKWSIATQTNVHGVFGPDLPDGGGKPAQGLAVGHPTLGLYVTK